MPSNADDVARNIGKFGDKIEDDIILRLTRAGTFIEGKAVDKITNGIPPALKPATIAKKKSSHPLIDTGELLSQVTIAQPIGDKFAIMVGVFGSRSGIAAVHEMGAPSKNIPARPFLGPALKENKAGVIKILTGK